MNYSGIASSIKSKVSVLNNIQTVINGIDFEGVWSSAAYESLSTSLNNIISSLNSEKGNLQKFANALVKLDEYVALVKKIKVLQDQLNGMPDKTKEENDERKLLMDQISALNTQKQQLRADIVSQISSFGVLSSQYSLINFGSTSSFDYVVDVGSLLGKFENNELLINKSLYGLYDEIDDNGNVISGTGKKYVNDKLDLVLENYSDREATVNSALVALQLAADKDKKLYYTSSGANMGIVPYNTNDQLQDGMDCCAFVSWALNKGTAQPFHWEGVSALRKMGQEISFDNWSQAQPGDIFVSNGHVGLIIENNFETSQFVVADARGSDIGIVMRTISYDQLNSDGFQVRDFTTYYTGEEKNINPYDHN